MENAARQLTEQLLTSYREVGGINHLDGKNLPSKRAISLITQDLLRLLFPGFFDERVVHSSEVRIQTATLLDSVQSRLEDELFKSLEYEPPEGARREELRRLARQITVEFLAELPEVRELLRTDVEAAYNGDPAALSQDEVIVAYPCVEAVTVQRLAHRLYRRGVPLIPRIMTEWAHGRTGMDLHPGARIGEYFFIDHGTGTVIGETSALGHRVKLYQGVGLVARSLSAGQALRGKKRHPTLEDRVTVYSGATIMGGDTVVGAGSTIGAGVFLTHSVPANSLVVNEQVRVKVLAKKRRQEWLDYQI
ncbi:MAG: serine acetyltransferase [Verrucomicrobia bacterium]|nr:serine acetyltransferase [Verrucomicrobiota bacterium]